MNPWRKLVLFARYHLKARAADHPAPPEEDLGLVPFDFDIDGYAETIRAFGDRFQVEPLEEVDYEGRKYPLYVVRAQNPDAKTKLLIIAGIHGNEHAGLFAILRLLDAISEDRSFLGAVEVSVVTPANPVGAQHASRFNAEGYDINRDFRRLATPEARAILGVFEDFSPDFVLSLHEGPQPDGSFLFPNEHVDETFARHVLGSMEEHGTLLAEEDYFGRTLETPGYARLTPTFSVLQSLWDGLLGMRTMGMCAGRHGVPEITVEAPWRSEQHDARVAAHLNVIRGVVSALSRAR